MMCVRPCLNTKQHLQKLAMQRRVGPSGCYSGECACNAIALTWGVSGWSPIRAFKTSRMMAKAKVSLSETHLEPFGSAACYNQGHTCLHAASAAVTAGQLLRQKQWQLADLRSGWHAQLAPHQLNTKHTSQHFNVPCTHNIGSIARPLTHNKGHAVKSLPIIFSSLLFLSGVTDTSPHPTKHQPPLLDVVLVQPQLPTGCHNSMPPDHARLKHSKHSQHKHTKSCHCHSMACGNLPDTQ